MGKKVKYRSKSNKPQVQPSKHQLNGHQKPVPRNKGWVEVVLRWVFFVGCVGVAVWSLRGEFPKNPTRAFSLDDLTLEYQTIIVYDVPFLDWWRGLCYSLPLPLFFLTLGLMSVNWPRKRIITAFILASWIFLFVLSWMVIWEAWVFQFLWTGSILFVLPSFILGVALFIFYRPNKWPLWTGFGEYIPSSPAKGEYQRGKTLWDWMNVIAVLLVPIVIAAGSVWFSIQINDTNLQIAQEQRQAEIFKTYMDDITDLYLHEGLSSSKAGDKVREIATTKTLLALGQLSGGSLGYDALRRGDLVTFIYKLGLIDAKDTLIVLDRANLNDAFLLNVDLSGANLSGAMLSNADLIGANLSEADLSKAYFDKGDLSSTDLRGANLREANLSGADLWGADLTNAKVTNEQLSQVKSLYQAILPNGTKCTSKIVSECLKKNQFDIKTHQFSGNFLSKSEVGAREGFTESRGPISNISSWWLVSVLSQSGVNLGFVFRLERERDE